MLVFEKKLYFCTVKTYYATLGMFGGCMLAVARLAVKVGVLTEVFFADLCGALHLPKRNGGGLIGNVVASRKGSEINKLFVRKMCKMRVIFVRKMWNWLINGCFAKI